MNKNYAKLFEFLCELIDVQIKKYVALATIGIGPDADINAMLVVEEVNELIDLANILVLLKRDNPEIFQSIFNQTRFYVEQEFLRADAATLIDKNNIHGGVLSRSKRQLDKLSEIATLTNIDISEPAMASTDTQKQCQHDSHAIAFFILDVATTLKQNPDAILSERIPDHAQKALRRNAQKDGRYFEPEIAEAIETSHQASKLFLETSALEKRTDSLNEATAHATKKMHLSAFNGLLESYRKINPDSPILAKDYKWQTLATGAANLAPAAAPNNNTLFRKVHMLSGLTIGISLIGSLALAFMHYSEPTHSHKPSS